MMESHNFATPKELLDTGNNPGMGVQGANRHPKPPGISIITCNLAQMGQKSEQTSGFSY